MLLLRAQLRDRPRAIGFRGWRYCSCVEVAKKLVLVFLLVLLVFVFVLMLVLSVSLVLVVVELCAALLCCFCCFRGCSYSGGVFLCCREVPTTTLFFL